MAELLLQAFPTTFRWMLRLAQWKGKATWQRKYFAAFVLWMYVNTVPFVDTGLSSLVGEVHGPA